MALIVIVRQYVLRCTVSAVDLRLDGIARRIDLQIRSTVSFMLHDFVVVIYNTRVPIFAGHSLPPFVRS